MVYSDRTLIGERSTVLWYVFYVYSGMYSMVVLCTSKCAMYSVEMACTLRCRVEYIVLWMYSALYSEYTFEFAEYMYNVEYVKYTCGTHEYK